jgi:hypothetical protein
MVEVATLDSHKGRAIRFDHGYGFRASSDGSFYGLVPPDHAIVSIHNDRATGAILPERFLQ